MLNNRSFRLCHIMIVLLTGAVLGCSRVDVPPTPTAPPTRDPKIEGTAIAQLSSMNPDAVPIYHAATTALDAGELEKSRELYQKVHDMAPNFATAYRRLGNIMLASNDIEGGITLLRQAVALEPDAYNQSALALALLQRKTASANQEAFQLASAASKLQPEDVTTVMVWMYASASIENTEVLRQSDEVLMRIAPTNPVAHYYAGAFAATDGKWELAEKEMLLSQRLGMPEESVQAALDQGISRNATIIRLIRWGAVAMIVWLAGLLILFMIGKILSSVTLKALNAPQMERSPQINPGEQRIRSIYKIVVSILSIYFYISIPFVILLMLLVVAGAFYVFYVINLIPVQLALALVVMMLFSLYAIIRSIFSRLKVLPPGRALERMDAPALWAFVEDVARKLSIKPVDTIYLTPDVGIGVNERGSILKKMRGGGTRTLLLGMGAVTGLTQGQFATILAHEYGHFSNRDTAGGNLAHQVHASLHQMAQNMIRGRLTQVYNPVWLFIVGYQRIFLQVTLGASRLQEILADRYAALAYGSENFIDGLKNYIRQSIAFPLLANQEIRSAAELNRSFINLYDLPMQESLDKQVDNQFEQAMTRPTSKYDTHPAPKDRINLIERLHIPYSPMHENSNPVLDLFPNPEELQREMTAEIRKMIRK